MNTRFSSLINFAANHNISRQTALSILMICLRQIFTIMEQHEDASQCWHHDQTVALQKTQSLFLLATQSQSVTVQSTASHSSD